MSIIPVDKSPERIRRMFGTIANRYDLINNVLTLGIDYLWRKKAAQLLLTGELAEGDILDVCCGTGVLSFAFQRQQKKLGTERINYGIDFTPEMVEIVKKKAKGSPLFQFSEGDALDLPFEDDRFAAVAVAFGLRNVGNTERGLEEMVRVCKPGGTVAVLEFSTPSLPVLKQCYHFYFHTILPKLGQWFADNPDEAYSYLPQSVVQFDSPERLAERLTRLGVSHIRMCRMTFGIATLVWGTRCSTNKA